jgi:hypothetical protein
MNSLIGLVRFLLGLSVLIFLIFFPPLAMVALLIVPLTMLYAKASGQSYNFTIDQSETLYKLNKLGQWVWIFGIGFFLLILLLALG